MNFSTFNVYNDSTSTTPFNAYNDSTSTTPFNAYNDSTSSTTIMYNATEGSQNNVTQHQFPKEMLGFTAACAFIIAFLGTLGNLLTIFALPMCKKLRTTATAFVVNLAVVELLFCVFILPMSGAQYAYLQYNTESLLTDSDCVFFAVTRYTFTQVELQTIVGIALTRAVAVGIPSFYQRINNSWVIGTYIALIWLYSFLLKLPTGIGIFGSYVFNPKTMECDMSNDMISFKARFYAIIIEVLIPVSVVIILYVFIFVMVVRRSVARSRRFRKHSFHSSSVKKSSMRVAKMTIKPTKSSKVSTSSSEPSSPAILTEETSVENGVGRKASSSSFKNLKRMVSDSSLKSKFTRRSSSISHCISTNRRDMRVARTIFIIFLMIIVCSVPVGVIHGIDSQGTQPKRFLAVHILYWLQYCANVVVYVLMNRQYRDAYIECLAKVLPYWERHKGFAFPWETPSISSKPQPGFNSSFKGQKDSSCQEPAGTKEYKSVENVPPRLGHGRLSAILEVNSSSCVSNDDVFADDGKIPEGSKKDFEIQLLKEEDADLKIFKQHNEDGMMEEKQHWITQNGETVSEPQQKTDHV